MRDVRVGNIAWNHPEWRGLAYPAQAKPDELLQHYARIFDMVEVDATYYRMPKTADVASWVEQTPERFRFSFKLPAAIVRKPGDPSVAGRMDAFLERIGPARDAGKLGVIVAQFPPFFRRDKQAAALDAFVASLPRGDAWGIELRHHSWWDEATYALLRDAGITLVWSSTENGRTPPVVTADRLYLRLFGDRELEEPFDTKKRDRAEEIAYWAARVKEEGAAAKTVDFLVSKYLEGYAPGSVAKACDLLGVPAPDVGPREGRRVARQMTLD